MVNQKQVTADLIREWPPKELIEWKPRLSPDNYGILYSVYADLVLAQAWNKVQTYHLGENFRPLISGCKGLDQHALKFVYCVRAEASTSIKELDGIFQAIQKNVNADIKYVLLGIVHNDSTVVYYTLNKGITKPTVN